MKIKSKNKIIVLALFGMISSYKAPSSLLEMDPSAASSSRGTSLTPEGNKKKLSSNLAPEQIRRSQIALVLDNFPPLCKYAIDSIGGLSQEMKDEILTPEDLEQIQNKKLGFERLKQIMRDTLEISTIPYWEKRNDPVKIFTDLAFEGMCNSELFRSYIEVQEAENIKEIFKSLGDDPLKRSGFIAHTLHTSLIVLNGIKKIILKEGGRPIHCHAYKKLVMMEEFVNKVRDSFAPNCVKAIEEFVEGELNPDLRKKSEQEAATTDRDSSTSTLPKTMMSPAEKRKIERYITDFLLDDQQKSLFELAFSATQTSTSTSSIPRKSALNDQIKIIRDILGRSTIPYREGVDSPTETFVNLALKGLLELDKYLDDEEKGSIMSVFSKLKDKTFKQAIFVGQLHKALITLPELRKIFSDRPLAVFNAVKDVSLMIVRDSSLKIDEEASLKIFENGTKDFDKQSDSFQTETRPHLDRLVLTSLKVEDKGTNPSFI